VTSLARRLGTFDAVVIGLGSMIGAGVFSAFAPAAASAGSLLLVGLAVAAGVAYCNAVASAQLAAQYPTSGGTYVYGRERLGEWWGFLAGWGFVIGKTASCAAMAAVVTLTGVNLRGITRTAGLTRILVAISLVALAIVVAVILGSGDASSNNLSWVLPNGLYGVLQSAGLLFFAFAGYARIATLGEEVRDPQRTIPRAIPLALGITVALYAVVAASVLLVLGSDALAASATPLENAVRSVGADWAVPLVDIGAAVASLGALLALIAGIGRTTLAMSREGDLPRWLSSVHPRYRVPDHAELAIATAVTILVLTTDLRGAIAFSSFGVLTYYAIANASAWTQRGKWRRWPRALNAIGLVGCVTLVATLPFGAVVAGLSMFAIGLAWRVLIRRRAALSQPA
jgi:APA family basic amino acid/polyamine antiporter